MAGNDWMFIALGVGGLAVVGFLFKDEIMGFFQGGIPPDLEEPVGNGEEPTEEPLPLPTQGGVSNLNIVMRYYAQRVAEELDKYKEGALTRTTKFNLEGFVLQHYKSWLKKIAEYQNYQIKTLEGKGLAKFSGLVLEVASKRGIKLKGSKGKTITG